MLPHIGTLWRCTNKRTPDVYNQVAVVKEANLSSDLNGDGVAVLLYENGVTLYSTVHHVDLNHDYIGFVTSKAEYRGHNLFPPVKEVFITETDIVPDLPFLVIVTFLDNNQWVGYFKTLKGAKISVSKRSWGSITYTQIK